jgi:hypothetical protein
VTSEYVLEIHLPLAFQSYVQLKTIIYRPHNFNLKLQANSVPRSKHPDRVFKMNHLMLYGERIAIHTKHVNKAESY